MVVVDSFDEDASIAAGALVGAGFSVSGAGTETVDSCDGGVSMAAGILGAASVIAFDAVAVSSSPVPSCFKALRASMSAIREPIDTAELVGFAMEVVE